MYGMNYSIETHSKHSGEVPEILMLAKTGAFEAFGAFS